MLKRQTIIRAFQKRGWHWDEGGQVLMSYDINAGPRIFGRFQDDGNLRLYDARLSQHPNFHVVSYWLFRSMRELNDGLNTIERVYHDLCGTRFPCDDIEWRRNDPAEYYSS